MLTLKAIFYSQPISGGYTMYPKPSSQCMAYNNVSCYCTFPCFTCFDSDVHFYAIFLCFSLFDQERIKSVFQLQQINVILYILNSYTTYIIRSVSIHYSFQYLCLQSLNSLPPVYKICSGHFGDNSNLGHLTSPWSQSIATMVSKGLDKGRGLSSVTTLAT